MRDRGAGAENPQLTTGKIQFTACPSLRNDRSAQPGGRWAERIIMKNASRRLSIRLGVAAALLAGSGVGSWAIVTEVSLVDKLHGGVIEHEDETKLRGMRNRDAYNDAFTHGDAIFSDLFNAVDGAGANVGNGARFTRVPRPDL